MIYDRAIAPPPGWSPPPEPGPLGRALRLWRTIRHLRREQLLGQILHRSGLFAPDAARFPRPRRPFPGLQRAFLAGPESRDWIVPQSGRRPAREYLAGRFDFVGLAHEVGFPPRWEVPEAKKLWQYNLHYHEWIWALEYTDARAALSDWIERHPLRPGAVGWEPYPLSLRVQGWLGYLFGKHRDELAADPAFGEAIWRSLALQLCWLEENLETHILGNHLLENAVTLALAGSVFEGEDAARWHRVGLEILRRELPEQVLPDGMHFELSPMYHQRVCTVLVELCRHGTKSIRALVADPLRRALHALSHVTHPDGDIALFGDSAIGVYPSPREIIRSGGRALGEAGVEKLAEQPETGPWALPNAGYYGFRAHEGHYVICDVGPLGPDYLLGHAQADMLSYEQSIAGERVVRDPGIGSYEADPVRAWCQSAAAHNGPELGGWEPVEFWKAFRVGRRIVAEPADWEPRERGFTLRGAWRPEGRGGPYSRVERTFRFEAPEALEIEDRFWR